MANTLQRAMDSSRVQPPRIRVAIALSFAVHLCALVLIALSLGPAGISTTLPGETVVYPVTTIVYGPSAPHPRAGAPARQRLAPATIARIQARSTPPAVSRQHDVASRLTVVAQHLTKRTPYAAARAPRRTPDIDGQVATLRHALIAAAPLPEVAPPSPRSSPTRPAPVATPVASPNPTASPAIGAPGNFSGLFSQDYPPALPAPSIIAAIRSRLAGHGRIRIDVDESGHATAVQFTSPVADGAAEDVRSQLLDATYVPADCNGLHCSGTLEISY